jgi:hypothetical protein
MGRGDGGWSRLDECNPCFRQLPVLAFEACANILAMTKSLIRWALKAIGGIAGVVFFLARFTTNTGVVLFVGSIVVLLVCFVLLKFLEGDDDNTGFWPMNPKQ